MKSELKALIRSHRVEGEVLEEGHFSLGAEEALRKVSQFGLQSPEKGLLRLVQLAVQAECQEIGIWIGPDTVNLHLSKFSPEHLRLEHLRLEHLAADLKLESNNFPLALLACLHSGFERGWVLSEEDSWEMDQDGFQRIGSQTFEPDTVTIKLLREKDKGFWNRLKALLRRRCLDHKIFSQRLPFCPAELHLDRRLLEADKRPKGKCLYELCLEGPSKLQSHSIARPETRESRYELNGKHRDQPSWKWRTFETARAGAKLKFFCDSMSGVFSLKTKASKRVLLAHLWIPMRQRSRGKIRFVRNGVVIGSASSGLKLPVSGVVSADGLDVDLSGLELVHNKKLQKLLQYLDMQLNRRLRDLAEQNCPKSVRTLLRAGGYYSAETSRGTHKRKQKRHREKGKTYDHRVGGNDSFNTKRKHLREKGSY